MSTTALSSVASVSNAAPATNAAQLQVQTRATAAAIAQANANSASAALASIVDNATRTALLGGSPSFVRSLENAASPATGNGNTAANTAAAPEANAGSAASAAANANGAESENAGAVQSLANAAPAPSTAPLLAVPTPSDEAAQFSNEAQTSLVQHRIAQDIATAFEVVSTDQTYSSAATAMYLSAAVYRLQVERPKEPDLATPGPVQPIKAIDAIASSTDFSLGDSTTP